MFEPWLFERLKTMYSASILHHTVLMFFSNYSPSRFFSMPNNFAISPCMLNPHGIQSKNNNNLANCTMWLQFNHNDHCCYTHCIVLNRNTPFVHNWTSFSTNAWSGSIVWLNNELFWMNCSVLFNNLIPSIHLWI